ncbi:MAG: YfjI family protein [Coprococcus sp.]
MEPERNGTAAGGLTGEERRRIIDSIIDNEMKDGISGIFGIFGNIEEKNKMNLPLFPLASMPEVIGMYTVLAAESLQVPFDMIGTMILSVLSLSVQGKYKVLVKPDWIEPVNLYTVVIARPSERKSPSIKLVFQPVYSYTEDTNKRLAGEIAAYKAKKKVLKGRIDAVEKSLTSDKPKYTLEDDLKLREELRELEEEPVNEVRLIVDDVTAEGLLLVLKENNERLALVSAEGGVFLIMAGQYGAKNTKNTNIDIYLKAYSGEPYTSDRAGRESVRLKEPLLTFCLAIQPQVLREIMENDSFRGRGLLARFLYCVPESRVGSRQYKTRPIEPEAKKNYEDLVKELLSLPDLGDFVDNTIKLSPEADKLSEEFNQWIEVRLTNEFEMIEDWAGKLHGQVMRIAGLFHIVEHRANAVNVPMSVETLQNAIDFGKYYLEHAKAAFELAGLADPPEIKDAIYIVNRIAPESKNSRNSNIRRITKRDAWQLCKGHFSCLNEMEPGLNALIEHGYIAIIPVSTGKRGRPSDVICINPEYFEWKENKK